MQRKIPVDQGNVVFSLQSHGLHYMKEKIKVVYRAEVINVISDVFYNSLPCTFFNFFNFNNAIEHPEFISYLVNIHNLGKL